MPRAAARPAASEPLSVWLYVPNLIGYARIVTGVASFYYAFDAQRYMAAFGLYLLSYSLDALDGVAARRLGQTSRFGAVLDMVTDRVCTAALLAALAHLYAGPGGHHFPFLCLLALDVGAHWVQMVAALSTGSASHKSMSGEFSLVRLYYNWVCLFSICLANEACLAMLFLHGHARAPGAAPLPWP